VSLQEGHVLYLPCGWFHEVTSAGEHCALNYWFHPPTTRRYRAPYHAADFWKREWRRVKAQVAAL
jgi:ribosomal protein L16 Arg81 hydroxylase